MSFFIKYLVGLMAVRSRNTARAARIQYFMKLLDQILNELGGDTLKSFTVIPQFGGYFRSIKYVKEFSSERVCLSQKRNDLVIEGEGLEVGSCFQGDVFIKGNIKVVKVE